MPTRVLKNICLFIDFDFISEIKISKNYKKTIYRKGNKFNSALVYE